MLEWEQPPPEPVVDADGVPTPDQPPAPGPEYDEETGEELPRRFPSANRRSGCGSTCGTSRSSEGWSARTTR